MVTPVDVGGSIAKGMQINQLKAQMEAHKQAQQEQRQLKSLYAERFGGTDPKTGITWNTGRQAPGGAPAMNNEQFVGRAMAINPQAGLDWQKHFASQDAAELERQKVEAPLMVAAFEGVRDQAGYDQARAMLAQRGVDVSDIPPQYDPKLTNMVLQGSRYLAGGMPQAPAPTNVAKLIAERDALPPGDPRRATYDAAIAKATTHKPGDNITVGGGKYGTIPPGYELVEGPGGAFMRPIPGGPVATEQAAAEEAAAKGQKSKATTANIVVEDIDRVFDIMENTRLPVTGFGSWASAVPGTPQHDVAKLVDTVRANVGFDKLQAMREASPTGGALGQVSENENRLLQSTLGNLELSQSPEQFRRNLERVREVFLDIVHGVGERPEQGQGGGEAADFSAMAPHELLSVDVDSLNAEQLKKLEAAMDAAGL